MKVWWKYRPWTGFMMEHWIPNQVFIAMVRCGYADTDGQLRLFG